MTAEPAPRPIKRSLSFDCAPVGTPPPVDAILFMTRKRWRNGPEWKSHTSLANAERAASGAEIWKRDELGWVQLR